MSSLNETNWQKFDDALLALMQGADALPDADLRLKTKRLMHLSAFTTQLAQRVGERLREGTKQGNIDILFEQYFAGRQEIDKHV